MPGVPPDAVDRLKKGIKGLFSKNKKSKESMSSKSTGEPSRTQSSQPTSTRPEAAEPAETSKPAKEQPAEDKPAEDKPAEDKPTEDKPADVGVTAPAVEETQANEPVKAEEAGSTARQEARKDAVGSMPPEAKPKEHAEGMSATSGPLQDDPEFAHATQ